MLNFNLKVMKHKILLLVIISTITLMQSFTSCSNDFFESPDDTTFNEDSIFVKMEYAQRLLNQVYSKSPRTLNPGTGDRLFFNCPDVLTDLAAGFLGQPSHGCHKFHNAQLTSKIGSAVGDREGEYVFQWTTIRYAHILLDRIDEVPNATQAEKDKVKGECHLILAWHNFEMWRRFGGIPLVKKRLDNVEDQKITRATFQETYNYIIELLDLAINNPHLPARAIGQDFARVNKAFAYALKARVKLYAASPLFNTGTPFVNHGENNIYICWGNFDKNRWKEAADQATEAINFCESNGFAIVDDPAKRMTGENYLAATAKTPSNGNSEIIYGWQQNLDANGVSAFLPRGTNFNGWHCTVPTHNLVELYRNTDGTFVNWNTPITTPANDPTYPFKDLEPRFQVSIAHNGSQWITGTSPYALQFWNNPNGSGGGAESPQASSANYSYVTWKFSHGYENIRKNGGTWWVMHVNMRLSEMYMIRAEAMNEFSGPSANVESDLNKILNRSGMSVPSGLNYEDMKAFIERENAIEFFLEDHRYMDLKRTLRAMDVLNFEAVDARCVKNSNNTYTYTRTPVQTRYFLKHYYLWPFNQEEMNKNYGLIQNPGW